MEKKTFKNFSDLVGNGVEIKESPKTLKKKEEQFFTELIGHMCQIEAHTALLNAVGINIDEFQKPHLTVFEMLLNQMFNSTQTSIIMWWVFESIDENGKVCGIIDDEGKEHIINTATQLYKFIKKHNGE